MVGFLGGTSEILITSAAVPVLNKRQKRALRLDVQILFSPTFREV